MNFAGSAVALHDGAELNEFGIARSKVIAAHAVSDEEAVVGSAVAVKLPQVVQFGWHRTAQPNVINGVGLPAMRFQSNNWQGRTG